ncbi:MAG: hypothetical protein J0I28_03725 [Caulobacterales bacterium]|nr:hypothetical protein [Caulobacterales bacterium]
MSPAADPALERPLSAAEFVRLQRWTRRIGRWTQTRRQRRLLFLALAAPGFLAVFTTGLHQQLWLLVVGLVLFGAACLFCARTERLFVRAEASAVWPPASSPRLQEDLHA